MKKITTFTGLILLFAGLLVLPLLAISQESGNNAGKHSAATGMEKDRGHWREGASNITSEQREQIRNLNKKFREDNADTIKQLMAKHFDLETMLNSNTPDLDKARAIQKEVSDLNAKLAQKRIDLYQEIRKINPKARFYAGAGRGHHLKFGMMGRMHKGMGA